MRRKPVGDRAVVYGAKIHGRDVFLIRIEDHMTGDAVILFDIGKRVVNARAVESGLADGVEQRVHCVVRRAAKCSGFSL